MVRVNGLDVAICGVLHSNLERNFKLCVFNVKRSVSVTLREFLKLRSLFLISTQMIYYISQAFWHCRHVAVELGWTGDLPISRLALHSSRVIL